MTAKITTKIGPVKATFTGGVTLSDLDPPNSYTINGEGKGGAAGFASGAAKVTLRDSDGGTLLQYTVDAMVGGKLAQIGSRLIDSVTKKLAAQFFGALAEKLSTGAEAETAPESPGESATAPKRGVPTPAWVVGVIAVVVVLILWASGVF